MVSVIQGGGANITDRGTQGRSNTTADNSGYLNTSNNKQYQRNTSNDANEWTHPHTHSTTSQTTTITTNEENNTPIDETILQIETEANDRLYRRWHVPRLGNMQESRPDGVFRFMGAQLNSISSSESRDRKVTDIDRIMDDWEVQAGCFQEVGVNWSATGYNRNMSSWFRLKNQEIRTHTAHNIHENIEAAQQGGVGQFVCKELASYARETEADFRGLGRWSSWLLYANPSHKTRVITAYNLGNRKSNYLGTIYQQHLRYIQLHDINSTPYELFMEDFTTAISQWISAGERLLLFIDLNEHVLYGKLATKLLSLGLIEATHPSWGPCEPNTHISGSKPIDGVFHTSTLEITSTLMLSFHEGVGDHRTILVDVTARSLLGTDGLCIVRPAARRLICSNKKAVDLFIKYVEGKLAEHRLYDRLAEASRLLQKNHQDLQGLRMLEIIDTQTTQILISGERNCRKITNRPLPFSAPVAHWLHRKWAYQGLLRLAQGNCRNPGNARRRAKKEGLDAYNLTRDQCEDGVRLCNEHLKQLKTQASGLRKVHLHN
jgi:hypothetical protein